MVISQLCPLQPKSIVILCCIFFLEFNNSYMYVKFLFLSCPSRLVVIRALS